MLLRKMIRDMRTSWIQFLIIFLMAMAGVFVFSGINSVLIGMEKSSNTLLTQTNYPDYFFYTNPITQTQIDNINKIDGVKKAEPRYVYNSIISIYAQQGEILSPLVVEGIPFDPEITNGVWIGERYARLNNIQVGEKLTVEGVSFTVKGLVVSSEKLYISYRVQHLSTYAYISSKSFTEFNNIVLQLEDDANATQVINAVKDVLGNKLDYYYSASTSESISQLTDKTHALRLFSYIFPVLLFGLAVLTMVTIMSRLVNIQRVQIGTLMALGYNKRALKMHYLSYGLWLGIIGGFFGLILGHIVVPGILCPLIDKFFLLPAWDAPLSPLSFLAVGVASIMCLLATLISMGKKLSSSPSSVLKERELKTKTHSVVEKIPFVWNKLSLESKVTLRNISKNRLRAIMAFFGVAISMMLVLSGLGIQNSLDYTYDVQLNEIYKYDYVLKISEKYSYSDLKINQDHQTLMRNDGTILQNDNASLVSVIVFDKGNFLNLGRGETLANDGVIISKSFAKEFGLKVGDFVDLFVEGHGQARLSVAQIFDIPISMEIYVPKDVWLNLGYTYNPRIVWLGQTDITQWQKSRYIDAAYSKARSIELAQEASKMFDAVVLIMTIGAMFLSVVVLSNLALLSFAEMRRQYSILKVLGLNSGELRRMSFLESAILSAGGWLAGLPLGKLFLRIYMSALSSATSAYFSHIDWTSYLYATLITFGFALAINFVQGLAIKKLDLVNSLKAYE